MAAELAGGVAPRDLVPGDPDAVDRLAARLSVFASGMTDAAHKLGDVEAARWSGPAADAFGALVGEQPKKYRTAGTSFGEAVGALRAYTAVLRRAQADAGRAVTLFEQASSESERWRTQRAGYDADVRAAEARGDPPPSGPAPPASDPGGADRGAGQQLLAGARAQVQAQGRVTAARLIAAADEAPDKPGLLDRVVGGAGDFFGGVWEGIKGLGETVVMIAKLTTIRMLIDPEGWQRDVTSLGKGLWWGITHPVEFGKAIVDWETWKSNPLRAFGKLVPDIAIAIATAGAGTAATAASRGAGRGINAAGDVADTAHDIERATDGAGDTSRALPDPATWPASGARLRPRAASDIASQDRWATAAYDDIARNDRDVGAIADHVGDSELGPQEIADIKHHVFRQEHPLETHDPHGNVTVESRTFDVDADMAEAWLRLRAGRHLPEDVMLLRHELAELRYLREHPGASYRDAHAHANLDHPWERNVPTGTREDIDEDW